MNQPTVVRSTPAIPWMVTVPIAATIFADAGKTHGAIRMDIFKAEQNGLAAHGAIVRLGRKVLLDANRYGNWIAGRPPGQS